MKSANVMARVEPDVKEQAERIIEKLGLSTSSVINVLYRQIIYKNGLPFPLTLPADTPARDIAPDGEAARGPEQEGAGGSVPPEEACAVPKNRTGGN